MSDDGTCRGLAAYVPERIAGLPRSRMVVGRHPDVIAELNEPRVTAAYKLSEHSYANLELGCVDPAVEAQLAKLCALNVAGKKTEQVAGFAACVTKFVDHPEEGDEACVAASRSNLPVPGLHDACVPRRAPHRALRRWR